MGEGRRTDVSAACGTEFEGTYSWPLRGSFGGAPGLTLHSWG